MKCSTALALLVVVLVSFMALASTAAASILTSPSGTTYAGDLKAASEGYITIDNAVIPDISCNWALEWKRESGWPEGTLTGSFKTFTITGCTNEWVPTVASGGGAFIHPIHGGPDGTLEWNGATVWFTHKSWGTCRYIVNGSTLPFTSSDTTGGTATLDLGGGDIQFHSGFIGCQQNVQSPGSLRITSPDYLSVDMPGAVHAVTEEPSSFHLEGTTIECGSTLESVVEAEGSVITAGGPIKSLTFSKCTGTWEVSATEPGTLDMHPVGGGPDGTLTLSGTTLKLRISTLICSYKATSVDLGTFTGSSTTGGTARLDTDGLLEFHSGAVFCPKQAGWTAGYPVNDTLDF
jgi:hypothetical protein